MHTDELLGISPEGFHHIAYTEWGDLDHADPAVICVHGFSRNGRDFDALASYMSEHGRHVFCPDVVGRGESAWFKNSCNYNFTQYMADMTAMIARTQTEQVDWIGTSMGGMIGMMLAALPNSPIRHLILNDVGAQIPLHGLKKLGLPQSQPQFKSMGEAKEYFKLNHAEFGNLTSKQWDFFTEHSVTKQGPNLFVCKLDPGVKHGKSTTQMISDFIHHPHKSLEGIWYDIDMWCIWNKIKCPVLIIRGEHSEVLTPEITKKMLRSHDNTQVYEIEDAGHAPALLDPENHQTINDWLNS